MKNFTILPHTSDIRLKIQGDSMRGLFISALEGMNFVFKSNLDKLADIENTQKLNIKSGDSSMLLIDFLSEILTLSHMYKSLYDSISFQSLTNSNLIAEIKGKKINGFDEDIKAVSYTETNIKKNENGLLEAIVVFDI
jgi:SHS2 domain-containing protein